MATLDWNATRLVKGAGQNNADRRAIVSWICSFCGTEADLLTRFGLTDEAQRLRYVLDWALSTGCIAFEDEVADRPPFLIPTERGMTFAAMGFGRRYVGLLGGRSHTYNRTVASVMAALGNMMENDEDYSEYRKSYGLWDQWTLRGDGRGRDGNYKFAVKVLVGEGTQVRLPAAVLNPKGASSYRPILIEVLSEDMKESEIRSILANRHKRRDVLCVFCYVAAKHHEFVWQTILDAGAQEKIFVYEIPEAAGAAQLMELEPNPVPDSAQLVADMLECVGEFEMASVSGLAGYLRMGEHHLQMLLAQVVKRGLLRESQAIVDGVSVYSLTDAGLREVELDRRVVDVTMQGARQAKERLRVAAVLKRERGSDWIVMSRSQMAPPGEESEDEEDDAQQVPWIEVRIRGALHKLYADLILRERDAPKEPPVAVMVITKHYTPVVLNAIATAWAQRTEGSDRLAREAILYVDRERRPDLKRRVRELGASKRVLIVPQLETELVIMEDRVRAREEQKQREAEEKQRQAAARQARRNTPKAQRAAREPAEPNDTVELRTPERNLITAPDSKKLSGVEWISDHSAKVIESMLRDRGVDIDQWTVHWRYIVNVALWCVQRKREFNPITAQTYGVSRQTFELRVLLMYNVGVWQAIPGILRQQAKDGREVDRGYLNWGLIDVERFTRQAKHAAKSGRYQLRGDPPRYVRLAQIRERDFTSYSESSDERLT